MTEDRVRALVAQLSATVAELQAEVAKAPAQPKEPIGGPVVKIGRRDDLQAAIDGAAPGSTIRVAPGIYNGLVLHGRAANLTIRPDTADFDGDAKRVTPEMAPSCIQLRPTAGQPETNIVTEQGAVGYRLIGVQCLPGRPDIAMAALGSPTETDPARQPRDLVFDRCLFLANGATGGKRGIAANTGAFSLIHSIVDGFWWPGQDSQAFASWNGPGPFAIEDNRLAASGECVIFGGTDSASAAMMAKGITVRGNVLTKSYAWRNVVAVKNCLEFKAATDALVENNLIENTWLSGQDGYLVVVTPRNQDGGSPWTRVANITIRYNVIRHGAGGINILGLDNNHPSERTASIKILHNLFEDIDPQWRSASADGWNGRLWQVTGGPVDVEFVNNTCRKSALQSFLALDGPPAVRLRVHHNLLPEGEYGITGADRAPGVSAWDAYAQDGTFASNIVQRGMSGRAIPYPGATIVQAPDLTVPGGIGADLAEIKRRMPDVNLTA